MFSSWMMIVCRGADGENMAKKTMEGRIFVKFDGNG